jgi:nucleotide-binding universal stress UspA family protein
MSSTTDALPRHAKKRNVLIPLGPDLELNRKLFAWAANNVFDDADNVFVCHYLWTDLDTKGHGLQVVNIDKHLYTPEDSEDHASEAAEAEFLPRAVSDALRRQRKACPSATCVVFKIYNSATIHSAEEALIQICKGSFQSSETMFPDNLAIPKPDIVCMGARGRGILKRFVLGSVSNAVVSRAECSVCVFRDTADFDSYTEAKSVAILKAKGEKRAICIALGGSDASIAVVKWVAKTLLRPTDRVVLLHCEDKKKSERSGLTKESIAANMSKCEEVLRGYLAKHPDPAGQEYCIIEEEGESPVDVRDRMLDFIQTKTDINLLVLGKSNRPPGIQSALLGTLPRYALNHGKCPILVVNPPAEPAPKVSSEIDSPAAA